jgi:predicted dehydrogenase
MALSAAEADQMISAAKKNKVQLRVYETFVFYPPAVKAKELIDEGVIGTPQMIRAHVNTGTPNTGWKVPLNAWFWRFDKELCGGGPLVFDHGYHLFSLIHHLMGPVERVYAWLDQSEYAPGILIDAPANIMFQFKTSRRYGQLDFAYTPKMKIFSKYYTDDDRVEIIGDKGILFINRYTARTIDLPPLMLFKDGKTSTIPVKRAEWEHSFIDCTRHFINILQKGGTPVLDGPTGKSVLQFTMAALQSSKEGREVRPDDVK